MYIRQPDAVLTKLLYPPLRPHNRSGEELSVTVVTVPLGSTSSYPLKLSTVKPYWFVFHE